MVPIPMALAPNIWPSWHPPAPLHLPAAAAARAAATCLRHPADPVAAGIASAPAPADFGRFHGRFLGENGTIEP